MLPLRSAYCRERWREGGGDSGEGLTIFSEQQGWRVQTQHLCKGRGSWKIKNYLKLSQPLQLSIVLAGQAPPTYMRGGVR